MSSVRHFQISASPPWAEDADADADAIETQAQDHDQHVVWHPLAVVAKIAEMRDREMNWSSAV